MARRMYDLDNGTEDIKVNSVATNFIFYVGSEGFEIESSNITLTTAIVYFGIAQLALGSFTTIERPSPLKEGVIIYDSTLKKCILYNGTAWVNLDGSALS